MSASRKLSISSFSSSAREALSSLMVLWVISAVRGRARLRQALRRRSLAALIPTRKIQARKLRTVPSDSRARQHLTNVS